MKKLLIFALIPLSGLAQQAGTFTYSSSIDPTIVNLKSKYFLCSNNAPVIVMAHGYNGSSSDWNLATFQAFTNAGFSCIAPSQRGLDGCGGVQDDTARENYDYYDALIYAQNNLGVSKTNCVMYGVSNGGCETYGAACHFPDTFAVYAAYFGISDYGFSLSNSWYFTTAGDFSDSTYRQPMRIHITGDDAGGTPPAYASNYQARAWNQAVGSNVLGGRMFIYVNNSDPKVAPTNSWLARACFTNAGNPNFTFSNSATIYTHSYPTAAPESWEQWRDSAMLRTNGGTWTFPTSGKCRVMGYLVTKRFTIWLGGGTNEVADLTWDANAATYTVTPVTGTSHVLASQPGFRLLSTNITTTTTFALQSYGALYSMNSKPLTNVSVQPN